MADFRVLGHRGAILPDGSFYQNSLPAFAEALAFGDGFETDACASRDGDIFLIHEAKYVDTASGVQYCAAEHLQADSARLMGSRKLEEMSSAEIRQLRLKDGSSIPELPQVLQQVASQPGRIIDIELKGFEVLEPVLRITGTSGIGEKQVMLSSFNHPALLQARRTAPGCTLGAIFVAADTKPAPLFPWHPGSAGQYQPFIADSLSQPLLQDVAPDYIVLPDTELNEHAVGLVERYFPAARIFAWVFTERGGTDPKALLETIRRLAPSGKLAGLMIDNPRKYAAALRQAAG